MLDRPSLGKALLTCPQLLGVGFKSLRAGFDFLIELGIPRARAARLVERFPHILKYSVEGNLRPAADFLQRELGLSQEQLARLVEREPGCLQLSVERNLLPRRVARQSVRPALHEGSFEWEVENEHL